MAIPFRRGVLPALLATALAPGFSFAAESDLQLENIEVISLTPLHGVGLRLIKFLAMFKLLRMKILSVIKAWIFLIL